MNVVDIAYDAEAVGERPNRLFLGYGMEQRSPADAYARFRNRKRSSEEER